MGYGDEQANASTFVPENIRDKCSSWFLKGDNSKISRMILGNQKKKMFVFNWDFKFKFGFSRNLPGTTKSLGSDLQRLSVHNSACKHESTCPKEHISH